ncbi:MAG: DNA-formamidopyrimidine glycosylase family protein [Acidimicrobiia bacterium]
MPEILEIEYYRRAFQRAVGRTIVTIEAPDSWYLKGGLVAEDLVAALIGATIERTRRTGKLLLGDLDSGHVLGLRFGMTGRLIVDDDAVIEHLEYSSMRDEPAWDRLVVRFADGGDFRMRDPRRLGGVLLDPDETMLGIDAFTVTVGDVRMLLGASSAPLKARLMDQGRLAGMGNLLTDETLWRAGLDPARPANSLSAAESKRLHKHLRATLDDLLVRGGSHTGDLMAERHRNGVCPKDATPLARRTIGGRTTYSCPRHQR